MPSASPHSNTPETLTGRGAGFAGGALVTTAGYEVGSRLSVAYSPVPVRP